VKLSYLLITLFVFTAVSAGQEQVKTVIASGQGNSGVQALEQAKRSAVEQALGTVLTSETLMKNYQLASDKILSRANGFLKNYREVSSNASMGIFTVTIEAEVTAVFSEIMKDQAAIDLLLSWMNKPRWMIIVEENNCGQRTEACETEINRKLSKWHFDLVSKRRLNPASLNSLDKPGGISQVSLSAYREGAELILIGKALTTEKAEIGYLVGTGMKSVQADFTAQIIEASSGKIYASFTTHAPAVHISEVTAGVDALTKAAGEMADSLVTSVLQWASSAQITARTLEILVTEADFTSFNTLKKNLTDFSGIEGVRQRSFTNNEGILEVDYDGTVEDLAVQLDGYAFTGGSFTVLELSGNSVKIKFMKKY